MKKNLYEYGWFRDQRQMVETDIWVRQLSEERGLYDYKRFFFRNLNAFEKPDWTWVIAI